jgi:hypothetical protein
MLRRTLLALALLASGLGGIAAHAQTTNPAAPPAAAATSTTVQNPATPTATPMTVPEYYTNLSRGWQLLNRLHLLEQERHVACQSVFDERKAEAPAVRRLMNTMVNDHMRRRLRTITLTGATPENAGNLGVIWTLQINAIERHSASDACP